MQKLLRSSLLYLILIAGFLVLEGPLFAQNPESEPVAQEAATEAPQEDHDTKSLEQLLKRYNTDSEKILEDTSKIHNIQNNDTNSEIKDSDLESVKAFLSTPSKTDRSKKTKELPTKLSDSVRLALGPIQKLSEAELLKRLEENAADSPLAPYMKEFPTVVLFAVRLIKDAESIPSLVKIFENKKRLIEFGSIMLCTIIFAYVLKRYTHKEGRAFKWAAFSFFARFFFMMALRLSIIYYYFSAEFSPAIKVFKKTFF